MKLPEQVNHLTTFIESPIQKGKVKKWRETCSQLSQLSQNHEVELIILLKHEIDDGINYGCASCTENFPKTLKPSYERRTWRLLEDEQHIYFTLLVIDQWRPLDQLYPFCEKTEMTGVYLVQNNTLPTMIFLDKIDALVREY